jgi:hypothetical protein
MRVGGGIAENEGVIEESTGVEEDGFRFEEELGEEGEVLGVELLTNQSEEGRMLFGSWVWDYLMLLAIKLMNRIPILLVYQVTGRGFVL